MGGSDSGTSTNIPGTEVINQYFRLILTKKSKSLKQFFALNSPLNTVQFSNNLKIVHKLISASFFVRRLFSNNF